MARTPDLSPDVYIYTLSDPITGEVRYVGKTIKKLRDRLKIHIWIARHGNKTHRCAWIRKLLEQAVEPVITQIEMVEGAREWADRECYWIKKYTHDGARLTNATAGGEGWHGLKHKEESKIKIGIAHKGKVISADQKRKQSLAMSGRKLTQAHKDKLADANKGRGVSQATKIKISNTQSGKPRPETTGEKNGRALLCAAQARIIRGSDMKLSEIMNRYQISKSQASRVRRGIQWQE